MRTEALIVGAGPAGISTALNLLRAGVPVTLVSSNAHAPADRVDVLSPETKPELASIGIDREVLANVGVPCYGIDATWGHRFPLSHSLLHHPHGDGIAIRRSDFSRLLYKQAEDAGVDLRMARFVRADLTPDGWRVRFETSDIVELIDCRVLVEATGRASAISRYLGARVNRYDALSSVGSLVESTKPERILSVASTHYGWWYSTPVVEAHTFVCCVSDADVLRQMRATQRDVWLSLLRPVATFLSVDEMPRELSVAAYPCESAVLDWMGRSWIAVGDAAASFDPLTGTGILHALRSGRRASLAIAAFLRGHNQALLDFARTERDMFLAYLRGRRSHYRLERRFLEHEFWLRRGERLSMRPLCGTRGL